MMKKYHYRLNLQMLAVWEHLQVKAQTSFTWIKAKLTDVTSLDKIPVFFSWTKIWYMCVSPKDWGSQWASLQGIFFLFLSPLNFIQMICYLPSYPQDAWCCSSPTVLTTYTSFFLTLPGLTAQPKTVYTISIQQVKTAQIAEYFW